MKYLVSFVCLLSIIAPLRLKAEQDYALEWRDTLNVSSNDGVVSLDVNNDGYVYCAVPLDSGGSLIAKYDSNGNKVWTDTVGMSVIDIKYHIVMYIF